MNAMTNPSSSPCSKREGPSANGGGALFVLMKNRKGYGNSGSPVPLFPI